MKTFQSIQEERGEKAFKQAMGMGLKYAGFGYWKDPQTGETKFKTENDSLVPVEGREESELYKGGKPGEGMGSPDFAGGPGGGANQGMANAAGMLQMPGGGQAMAGAGIQGAPEPGEEQVGKDRSWEPGPDGDTCVGPEAEEPGKIPEDSFVGRTNFLKWRSGPDGDNITTVDAQRVEESTRRVFAEDFIKSAQKNQPVTQLDKHNNEIKEMVARPSFDLGQKGKELGAGNYGKVRKAPEKHNGKDVVIKEGEVFQDELKAMDHFKGQKGFPELVNAEINTPFKKVAGQMKAGNQKDEDGNVKQFGGRVAMEMVGDMELDEAFDKGAIQDVNGAAEKMWDLKKRLHQDGWYHGDMHDANVRWDSQEEEPYMIDFGKATYDPVGALFEALGGRDSSIADGTGDIVQGHVNPWVMGVDGAEELKGRIDGNYEKVKERMIEMAGIDPQKQPKKMAELEKWVLGGNNPAIMEGVIEENKEDFPFLQDDNNAMELIKMFYDGIGSDKAQPSRAAMKSAEKQMSLKQRMAAAADRRGFDNDD